MDTVAGQKHLIRRRFLESVSLVMMVLAMVALPFSLIRVLDTGLHINHLVHVAMSGVIVTVFLARKRLSLPALSVIIQLGLGVLSLGAFVQYGLVSAGFYFAGAGIFVAGVANGWRSGVTSALVFGLAVAVVAKLWMSGFLVFPMDVRQYILLPSVWVGLSVAFLITTAVYFVSATGFFRGLSDLVDRVEAQNRELAQRADELTRANRELETALSEIETLHGLLPICASCKKIRDDQGYWQQLEHYLSRHGRVEFTHSLCPDCLRKLYPEFAG